MTTCEKDCNQEEEREGFIIGNLSFLIFIESQSKPQPHCGETKKLSKGKDAEATPTEKSRLSPFRTTSRIFTQKKSTLTLIPLRLVSLFSVMWPVMVDW